MRKVSKLVMALVLCGVLIQSAYAIDVSDIFTDVDADDWCAEDLGYAVEIGMVEGAGANEFMPDDAITRAQFATMFGRVFGGFADATKSMAKTFEEVVGSVEFENYGLWYSDSYDVPEIPVVEDDEPMEPLAVDVDEEMYMPYVNWALENGYMEYVRGHYFEPDDALTVEEFAYILDTYMDKSGAVPIQYTPIKSVTDLNEVSNYAISSVKRLMRYGLLLPDEHNRINPNSAMTRSECVTLLSRYSQSLIPKRTVFEYSDLLPGDYKLNLKHDIDDEETIENNMRYMLKYGVKQLDFAEPFVDPVRGTVNSTWAGNDWGRAYVKAAQHYPEYGVFNVSGFNVDGDGNGRITINGWRLDDDSTEEYQLEALDAALAVRDRLYATGQLNKSMSEYDKAHVYYWWIVNNCDYDWDSVYGKRGNAPFAWMSFGPIVLRTGTCQGYTAAFNLFMRLEGVETSTVLTTDHIWSVATLDGTLYNVDTNWSDWKGLAPSEEWFAMTPEQAMARYE